MPLPSVAELQRRIASLEQQFFKLTGGQSVLSAAAASSAQAALSSGATPAVSAGVGTGTAATSGLMALQQLEDLASDGIITPSEKLQLNSDWTVIVAEGNPSTGVLVLQAAKYGLSATAFNAAYSNLSGYVTTSGIFTDMSSNTVLDRTVWDGYVEAYSTARANLAQIGAQLGENLIDSTGTVIADVDVKNSYLRFPPNNLRSNTAQISQYNTSFSIMADAVSLTNSLGANITKQVINVTVTLLSQNIPPIVNYGANGVATGEWAGIGWYYSWLIYNPSTDTVAGLISSSATSPTLPVGYTYTLLTGVCYILGVAGPSYAIDGFIQTGNYWSVGVPQNYLLTSTDSTSYANLPNVPISIASAALLWVDYISSGSAVYLSLDGANTWFRFYSADTSGYGGDTWVPTTGLGSPYCQYKAGAIGHLGIYLKAFMLNI